MQLCYLAFLGFHGCYATKHWWGTCPLDNPNDSLTLKAQVENICACLVVLQINDSGA